MTAGITVWFTGLSGSGKSTLATGVFAELERRGIPAELLDADRTRRHLAPDLGFSPADRAENVRRLGFVAGLLSRHGVVTLVAAISPFRDGRDRLRATLPEWMEVFVDAPLALCERRDPLGLYRRFRAGEIAGISGLDAPYEPPLTPDVHCRTADESPEQSIARVLAALELRLRSAGRHAGQPGAVSPQV